MVELKSRSCARVTREQVSRTHNNKISLLCFRADELAPDFKKIRVLLNHDGKVHWEPGGIFETTCDIDIRYFPFDEQSCPIQFGAWAYYAARMNMTSETYEVKSRHTFFSLGFSVFMN